MSHQELPARANDSAGQLQAVGGCKEDLDSDSAGGYNAHDSLQVTIVCEYLSACLSF